MIREVKDSKLVGRGGAAFPMGVKWEAVARQPAQPHYLIRNADESQPGRSRTACSSKAILRSHRGDDHRVFATNCAHGFVYLRGEYPQAHAIRERALAEARARGSSERTSSDRDSRSTSRSARARAPTSAARRPPIFNSIQRGVSRRAAQQAASSPWFAGLFSKPTVINNVETLVNVLGVLQDGGPAFAGIGTEGSTGTKLPRVSGHVARPGVYEATFGSDAR